MLPKPSEPIIGKHTFEFGAQIVEPIIRKAFHELPVDTHLVRACPLEAFFRVWCVLAIGLGLEFGLI